MWVTKIKSASGTAALSAFLCGFLTHFFALANVLHNYDDIAQQPRGYGTGVTSGRWLLSLLGDFCEAIGGNYNLPYINGVLFLILISLTAACFVSIFRIRSRGYAALVGALWTVFPSAFSTLAFRYTAVYYAVAILLSVLAAWVLPKCKFGLFLSALCTACALGIYQAYAPITISVFVLLLLQQSLEADANFRKLVLKGLYYCAALLLGLVLYFVLMKLTLALYCTQLSDYQGVNEMGKLSLQSLPQLVKEVVYSFVILPLKDYCGVTAMALLKGSYFLLGFFSFVLLGYLWWKHIRSILLILFGLLMCLLFPIAVNFIVIMCPDSWIYTLMIYAFVLVPCVPVILLEQLSLQRNPSSFSSWLSKGLALLLSVIISCYAYQTNVNYTALHYANRQVENYLNSLVVQVRMTEGFTPDLEWAFVGEIEDPLLHCYWQYEMTYGGIEFTDWMLQRYSWPDWVRNYYGYSLPLSDEETVLSLSTTPEVTAMPCWPAEGSIHIIDGTIVIKCQDLQ